MQEVYKPALESKRSLLSSIKSDRRLLLSAAGSALAAPNSSVRTFLNETIFDNRRQRLFRLSKQAKVKIKSSSGPLSIPFDLPCLHSEVRHIFLVYHKLQ
jgi:hypothetical protein